MTQHKSIVAALAAAQGEMEALTKNSTNPHFRAKYADLAAVVAATVPTLAKHGIAMVQPVGTDEHGHYVETVLMHDSGGELRCRVPLIVGKNDMQGFGSAVTYARRYGLMAMAGIAPEDDDGNAAAKAPPKPADQKVPKNQDAPAAPALTPLQERASQAERQHALESLSACAAAPEPLKGLAAAWAALPPAAKRDPMVMQAKDNWKAEFERPTSDLSEMLDDEVPA